MGGSPRVRFSRSSCIRGSWGASGRLEVIEYLLEQGAPIDALAVGPKHVDGEIYN
jgi:hypothetical protein